MSGLKGLWLWLARARNRTVLAFLGGGLAAAIAAAWQVYVHFFPAPSTSPPPFAVVPPVSSAGAENYAAAQNQAWHAAAAGLDIVTQKIDQANNAQAPSPSRSRP